MKTLNVTILCQAYYTSHIEVPDELTFEEALEYAKDHMEDIPIESGLEYIPFSDELNVENCDFEE